MKGILDILRNMQFQLLNECFVRYHILFIEATTGRRTAPPILSQRNITERERDLDRLIKQTNAFYKKFEPHYRKVDLDYQGYQDMNKRLADIGMVDADRDKEFNTIRDQITAL